MSRTKYVSKKLMTMVALSFWAVLAMGCSSEAGSDAKAARENTEPAVAATETLSMDVDDNTIARASRFADDDLRVEIGSTHGVVDFVAELRRTGSLHTTMNFTFYPPAAEEGAPRQPASNSFDFDSELPTLEGAIAGSVFVRSQFSSAVLGTYDKWGCDLLPSRFSGIISCGPKGACCDRHDACYAENGCTASSWGQLPWRPCQVRCNIPATGCFLSGFGNGPSVCCALGNCGQPR